jgi:hypothetical protein
MADITKRQLNGITACVKALKLKGKEKSKKMNCIMKCAMENEGLVSKEGDVTREQIDIILNREFPPALIDRANATFQPCVEKYRKLFPKVKRFIFKTISIVEGTLNANPETDPLCLTYGKNYCILLCIM